jgi:hypothetical protein
MEKPGAISKYFQRKGVSRMEHNDTKRLLVLWASGEKETAMNMVMLYSLNSKLRNWWDSVVLLVWGASARLLSEDEEVQDFLHSLQDAGVEVIACKKCAENIGVVGKLESLGVNVFYTGQYLTEKLQSGEKILSV